MPIICIHHTNNFTCVVTFVLSHFSHVQLCDPVDCSPEKAMAPQSSTLAWKIPWMEEPDRLQSMGSLRVRHD